MTFGFDDMLQIGAAFSQALLSSLWAGIAVSLAVALYVKVQPGLNAASRHAAWYGALVAIALMPMVSIGVSFARLSIVTTPAPAAVVSTYRSIAANPHPSSAQLKQEAETRPQGAALQPSSAPPLVATPTGEELAIAVALLAGTIAGVRIAFLLGGLFGLARVKRASRVVAPSLSPTLARTIAREPDARQVQVRLSDVIDSPAAAGFRSPAILLPSGLVEALDAQALDQIAMHEYAHLRRYDDWTNLFQKCIERLYWFNPAIWFVGSRIDLEREIACDDWAVAGVEGVSRYADCLLQLAHDGRVPAFAATAPGAFLTRNQISARIEHLLERHRDGAPALRPRRLLAIAPVLAAAVVFAAGRAPAIALHVTAPDAQPRAAVGVHMIPAPVLAALSAATPCPDLEAQLAAAVARRAQLSARVSTAVARSAAVARRAQLDAQISTAVAHSAAVARRAQLGAQNAASAVARRAQLDAQNAAAAAMRRATLADLNVQVQAAVKQALEQSTTQTQMRQQIIEHIHVENRVEVQRQVQAAVEAAKPQIRQAIRNAAPVIAAATESDNLSFGPNDRNLLAHCTGCDLSNHDLRNVDLHGLTLTGDDLSGSDLSGANLRDTVLTGVDLSDAKLDGADLRGAALTGSDIDGATFVNAKTDGIKLVGMQLTNAILGTSSARTILSACAGCDLSNLNLRGRDLHGITLDGADLHDTDLRNANLEGARFNGVDLSGVRFDGADLRHAEFNGCDLRNVDFGHAQTDGMQLQGSQLGSDTND